MFGLGFRVSGLGYLGQGVELRVEGSGFLRSGIESLGSYRNPENLPCQGSS